MVSFRRRQKTVETYVRPCYNGCMKKRELLFAGTVLAVAGAFFLVQRAASLTDGEETVTVYQEKEQIAVYSLREEREETIYGADGSMNRLVIRGGEAWIEDADCPDRLCVKQGRISRNGQAVTCLPHKLVITVESGKETELDGVTR